MKKKQVKKIANMCCRFIIYTRMWREIVRDCVFRYGSVDYKFSSKQMKIVAYYVNVGKLLSIQNLKC